MHKSFVWSFKLKFQMKFFICFQKIALNVAVENQNIEIVRLLLSKSNVDVNLKDIFLICIIKLKSKVLNVISTFLFLYHLNLSASMIF